MGLAHSPKIVTDGLVFAYDMGNPQKSWKGAPTTNLLTSLGNPEAEYARGEFGQYFNLVTPFEQNGLVPYSLSFEAKVSKPGNVSVYMQNGSYTKYSFVSQSIAVTTEWQKFKLQNLTPSGPTAAWQANSPADNRAMLATYTGYGSGINPTLKNLQLELGPYATPFVVGTRSNTQAIVDLTGNNTVTATDLTYNSDGTFEFAGGVKYLQLDTAVGSLVNDITLMAIVNLGSRNGPHQTAICTNLHYRFGLKLLASYHGGLAAWSTNATGSVDYFANGPSIENAGIKIICATRSASTGIINLYLNGSLVATTTGSTGSLNSTSNTSARAGIDYHSGGYGFNGKIYAASAYNRTLSAQEVQQNFNALRGRYGI
jgi:hypothetical protein